MIKRHNRSLHLEQKVMMKLHASWIRRFILKLKTSLFPPLKLKLVASHSIISYSERNVTEVRIITSTKWKRRSTNVSLPNFILLDILKYIFKSKKNVKIVHLNNFSSQKKYHDFLVKSCSYKQLLKEVSKGRGGGKGPTFDYFLLCLPSANFVFVQTAHSSKMSKLAIKSYKLFIMLMFIISKNSLFKLLRQISYFWNKIYMCVI